MKIIAEKEEEKARKFEGYQIDLENFKELEKKIYERRNLILEEDESMAPEMLEKLEKTERLISEIDEAEKQYTLGKIRELEALEAVEKAEHEIWRRKNAARKAEREYQLGLDAIFSGLKAITDTASGSVKPNTYIMNGKIINCQNLGNSVRSCNWLD